MARIAKEKSPSLIILENVKNLIYHDKGNTLKVIIKTLEELGYIVSWSLLNAKDFGVPQNRERIVLVASKVKTFDFSLLTLHKPVKLKGILEDNIEHEYLPTSEYTLIPKEDIKVQKSGLIFVGYRNKTMRVNGIRPHTENLSRTHKQPNRIYSSQGIHPTLSSGESSGRYFIYHEGKVRKMTLKECYRVMGFPEDFKIIPPMTEAYRRIGNSVCVPMMAEIAHQVIKQNMCPVN